MNIIHPFVVEFARIYETVNPDNTVGGALSGKKRKITVVIDNTTCNHTIKRARYN